MENEGTNKPKGASSLMGLFAPPAASKKATQNFSVEQFGALAREESPHANEADEAPDRSTIVRSNKKESRLNEPLLRDESLEALFDSPTGQSDAKPLMVANERTPLMPESMGGLFTPSDSMAAAAHEITPRIGTTSKRKTIKPIPNLKVESSLPPIQEIENEPPPASHRRQVMFRKLHGKGKECMLECLKPTALIGAFMFLLYHTVFCLTMGSAITRPHAQVPILGLMTKMASLGIMFGAPVYWLNIGSIPALYPTVDLFSAPFLAVIAASVDDTLHNDPDVSSDDSDQMFLGTFTFLACTAVFISGALLVLASVFKLANLGAFLPFPVLCGFFAAVGVLTWTLAFKVDTNGKSVSEVLFSGDMALIVKSLIHHAPSVTIAAMMKYLGPKSPFYVIGLVFGSIGMFYFIMFAFGISMEEAIEHEWFWPKADLVYEGVDSKLGFAMWIPPAPFGIINSALQGKIHWGAVMNGMQTTVALSFLYLIRCSLHGAALIKNVTTLSRVEIETQGPWRTLTTGLSKRFSLVGGNGDAPHRRKFSEVIDIEYLAPIATDNSAGAVVKAKATNVTLKEILLQYGCSQFLCGAVGGFAITPSVAASPTMYMLGAEGIAPQVGSVLLLSLFYLTDFQLVAYIPKPAFSSLLVLAFIDMTSTWFIGSYFKTKEKMEWLVVPLIVVLAFVIGLLGAVFLGIAMSTFLFVAAFFRSGVVKYVANGLNIRSTIERSLKTAKWLDRHGDEIQVIVLQNFLFFGNASSVLTYISSMFEEPSGEVDELFLPPVPRIVVLDMTLVTGMDTSAVDVISDILALFNNHDAKLFLSGVSANIRKVMLLGGVKPESIRDRSERKLRFFPDLDSAIGKAEDMLLDDSSFEVDFYHRKGGDQGFVRALRHIDEQHETTFTADLLELEQYTTPIQVDPGGQLYDNDNDRGLFFIENGVMKIERNSDFTLTRVGSSEMHRRVSMNNGSLNQLNARSGSIGKAMAHLKEHGGQDTSNQRFRLARIGPGWVLGSIEAVSGTQHPGSHVAVTDCRLHYISYKKIEEIEESNPRLALKLQKLISYLMAKRQEITIGQLATLHSIMGSTAQKKPIGRGGSGTMNSFYN